MIPDKFESLLLIFRGNEGHSLSRKIFVAMIFKTLAIVNRLACLPIVFWTSFRIFDADNPGFNLMFQDHGDEPTGHLRSLAGCANFGGLHSKIPKGQDINQRVLVF